MATIEEIEAKMAARRKAHDEARDAQLVVDLAAIDALEESRGEPLHKMTCNRFVSGQPVKVAFRAPSAGEYKRYRDMVGKAMQQNDSAARVKAQEMLAASVVLYPGEEARAAFEAAFPGTLLSLTIEAAKLAELKAEDDVKS
jgi:hypothetical protein